MKEGVLILKIFNAIKLTKEYQNSGDRKKTIGIMDIDLEIDSGDFIAVMGKSGSGKSTLLKIMGTIDIPTSGYILIKGERVSYNNFEKLAMMRRREIGFIFQDFYLINTLSIKENIMLPMILDGKDGKIASEITEKNAAYFDIVNIIAKYPYEISGGEKQRVAICRALSNNPDIILADEPTGNLDSYSTKKVIDSLLMLNQEYKKTVIVVTHDSLLASFCKKAIFLKDGKIEREIESCNDQQEFHKRILDTIIDIDSSFTEKAT